MIMRFGKIATYHGQTRSHDEDSIQELLTEEPPQSRASRLVDTLFIEVITSKPLLLEQIINTKSIEETDFIIITNNHCGRGIIHTFFTFHGVGFLSPLEYFFS
jgi:hypothetical protein